MTVIEAVVALSILGLVGSGFAVGMNQTLLVTQDDRLRQQATHLAERELEIARNRFQHADENGQLGALTAGTLVNDEPLPGQTEGQPVRIDGRDFTVRRTQYLITKGGGANACEGGSSVTYLSLGVTAVVSWSQNSQVRSVENRTILTPQKGVEGDVGYLAAKVVNASGQPVNGLTVNATGPSGPAAPVTTVDGCAVFMFTTPGAYTLSLNETGYVNFEGFQEVAKSATVEMGKLGVLPFTYDRQARATVTYRTAAGHALPQTLPGLTLFNSGLVSGVIHLNPASSPAAVNGLWPYPEGYSVWAGTCDQSDPSLNASGYPRPTSVVMAGGSLEAVSVYLAPVTVRLVDDDGVAVAGAQVVARPVSIDGCEGADAELTLGVTEADGSLHSALPAGVWVIEPGPGYTCEMDADTCPATTSEILVVDPTGGASTDPALVVPDLVVDAP